MPESDAKDDVSAWKGGAFLARLTWETARRPLVAVVCLTIVASLLPPASAVATKRLVNALAGAKPWLPSAALIVALGLISVALSTGSQYGRAELARRLSVAVPDRLFATLEKFQGLRWFDDPRSFDQVRLAQQAGAHAPQVLLSSGVGLLESGVGILGFAVVLSATSPLITAVLLLAGLPSLLAQMALSRSRVQLSEEVNVADRRRLFYQMLLTDPVAAKEIRLFGSGGYLRGRMVAELRGIAARERRFDRRVFGVQLSLTLCSAVGIAAAIFLGAQAVADGGASRLGDLVVILAAGAGVQAAVAGLVERIVQVQQILRLFVGFMRIEQASGDTISGATAAADLREAVEFRDVWFRYSLDGPWILRGLTMSLQAGGSTALVGLNGSGKSTVVKLLARLYDPEHGSVTWDGVDLRDLDVVELRRRVSAVFQDFMEYDLTAADNISMSEPSRAGDSDAIRSAAQRAGVHQVIEALPRGYGTMLTRIFFSDEDRDDVSTGVVPSGGQWQRIALARSLFRERHGLLILDEPNSGLDAQAEHELQVRLLDLRRGHTTLLISHRLGAARHAEQIVVIEDGRCVESGTHEELIMQRARYAELFELQAADYRDEVRSSVAS
jgi:ATP-binding cassette subfamily B protein